MIKFPLFMDLRITSYNCRSVKNTCFSVTELTHCSDVVCLQETWLPIQELNFLNTINSEFTYYATSPVDLSSQLLIGRPYGGVAFLYRKSLASCVQRVETSDNRLICIDMNVGCNCIRIINCYLPYSDGQNDAEYIDYLTKLHCLISDHSNGNVFVIGDFNAHPRSRFGAELHNFCQNYDYSIGDVALMPPDTYTWVSDATGHTRWLDHLVCPPALLNHIRNLKVLHPIIGSDHRPLTFSFKVNQLPALLEESSNTQTKFCIKDSEVYCLKSETALKEIEMPIDALQCSEPSCQDENHRHAIDILFSKIVRALQSSSDSKEIGRHVNTDIIPGWNEFVKDFHQEARSDYLMWRDFGKPRGGVLYNRMVYSRAKFKRTFKLCKSNKEVIVSNKIASNLKGNMKRLWEEIDKKRKSHSTLPEVISGTSGSHNIAELWKGHYCNLFNDDSHVGTGPIL